MRGDLLAGLIAWLTLGQPVSCSKEAIVEGCWAGTGGHCRCEDGHVAVLILGLGEGCTEEAHFDFLELFCGHNAWFLADQHGNTRNVS